MKTRIFKIYGLFGHRQRMSFSPSQIYDFSEAGNARIIEIENADKTGSNAYSIIKITRNAAEECFAELNGQISDGFFENCRIGKIEEIY